MENRNNINNEKIKKNKRITQYIEAMSCSLSYVYGFIVRRHRAIVTRSLVIKSKSSNQIRKSNK